jgi:hypothetical protein
MSGPKLQPLPVWAVASISAVAPGSTGGWYEALAASAPVRAAEEVLLGAHAASGLPWWGSILLTTVALRGAVTLPLAAYQHYILAKVRGPNRRRRLTSSGLGSCCIACVLSSDPRGHFVAKEFSCRWMC